MTTVQGNVGIVRTAARPEPPRTLFARIRDLLPGPRTATAQSGVGGITIVLEGTSLLGSTDPNGFFAVSGDFAGPVGVTFQRDDGLAARTVVDVPAGGTYILNDLLLDSRNQRATAEREDLLFQGLVLSTNCSARLADFVSRFRPDDGNSYTVRLSGSALRDGNGAPVACSSLQGGQGVNISGIVNRDGTIGAVDAEVQRDRSGGDDDDDDDHSGPGGGDDDDDDDHSGPGGGDDDDDDDDHSGPGGGDDDD